MPLPSTGLPTLLADMKDLYGLTEPDDASSSSKSQKDPASKLSASMKEAATTPSKQSKSKLGSMMSSLLGKKDNSVISQSGSNDSQATLTAAVVSQDADASKELGEKTGEA